MKTVTYDRGRIIDAPPEVVACLWSNWDIYDALLEHKFAIRKLAHNSWTATYYFSIVLTLEAREASLDAGRFVYSLRTTMFGMPSAAVVTLRYERLMSGKTSVHGEFKSDLTGLARIVEPLVRGKINVAVDAVIEGGQASCEIIAREYNFIRSSLPEEHVAHIDHYLETARRLRDGLAVSDASLLSSAAAVKRVRTIASSRRVFVVHGRNDVQRQRVCALLRDWDCTPVVLREQPNIGRTIIEKFEEHANADYAVILLTADDRGAQVGERNYQPRARQNVVFEMGYFIGRMTRERVCALYQEGVELPSDLAGILYIPLDDAGQWQLSLREELRAIGFHLRDGNSILVAD